MKRKKTKITLFEKIKAGIGISALLIALLFIPYNISKNILLERSSIKIKAIIIDDKNYFGNNTRKFSYSYLFKINNQPYTGNSLNSKFQIGDSVWVDFVPRFPRFNRIAEKN